MSEPDSEHDPAGRSSGTDADLLLDEYEVIRKLGQGGMASVYLVRHRDRGTLFAAKVPHAAYASSAEFRAALAREVQVWSALPDHPHIVRCYFVREDRGRPVIFAEYASEGTLQHWREQRRLRGLPHVIDVAIQIAEAMSIAETLGILHRDLKPSNCLMDRLGRVKISDFGLSDAIVRRSGQSQTGSDTRGTPAYCSPEQMDGRPIDARSDLWSFAVLLFEVLMGRRPVLGPAAPALVRQHLQTYGPGTTPPELWELLLEMLRVAPDQRPASFAVVSARLRAIYASISGKSYDRVFPQLFFSDSAESSEPGESEHTATLQMHAIGLLEAALREAGQDPARASRFVLSLPGHTRSHVSDLLGVISICMEAQRLLRLINHQGGNLRRSSLLISAGLLLATLCAKVGNYAGAIEAWSSVLAEQSELQRQCKSPALSAALTLASVQGLQNRAVCRRQAGDPLAADADYRKALTLLESRSRDPRSGRSANLEAAVRQNQALALLKAQRYSGATELLDRAIEIRRQLVRREEGALFALDLATTLVNRGVLRRQRGDYHAAIADYTEALTLAERPGAAGEFATRESVVPQALLNRAAAHLAVGDHGPARADSDAAIAELVSRSEQSNRQDHLMALSQAYNNRANAHRHLGQSTHALNDIDRCIALRQQLVDDLGRDELAADLSRAQLNKALFLMDAGRVAEAWPVCSQSVRWLQSLIERKSRRDLNAELAKMELVLSQVYCGIDQPQAAFDQLKTALHTYTAAGLDGPPEVREGWLDAIDMTIRMGLLLNRLAEASEMAAMSVEAMRESLTAGSPVSTHLLDRLERACLLVPQRRGNELSRLRAAVDELTALRNPSGTDDS